MAEQPCLPQVQACAIRVSKLNADGSPVHGAGNVITSDALVSMAVSPQYTDGDEITLNNACGTTVVNYKANDTFKRVDVTLTLSSVDPYLQSFLSGGTILNDAGRIGFAAPVS